MTEVTVVGGGLAGMTAAYALAGRGVRVRLLEAAAQLGGMAGSTTIDGYVEDHGLHIFPGWYRNVHRLIDQLGIADNFVDCGTYYQLKRGEFPTFRSFRSLFTLGDLVKDLRSGVTPAPDRLLFYYALVDLLSQRYGRRRAGAVRDTSLGEFLRSRWYLTEVAISDLEHVFLTASATESAAASAASFRASVAAFSRYPRGMKMPRASLAEAFIDPFQRRLVELGVAVRTGCELVGIGIAGGRVSCLRFRDGSSERVSDAGQVVLAIPPGRVMGIAGPVDAHLVPAGGVRKLVPRPLGALHLHLRRVVPELPRQHVRLVASEYAISFIDVGQLWADLDGSVLNCVIGRVDRLRGLPDDEAVRLLLAELVAYLPCLSIEDVKHVAYQPHFDQPFFTPAPDSWRYRPRAATTLSNLHMAGDYCAVPEGIAGMEAAVISGFAAAESVRLAARLGGTGIVALDVPAMRPGPAFAGKLMLAPVALVGRLLAG